MSVAKAARTLLDANICIYDTFIFFDLHTTYQLLPQDGVWSLPKLFLINRYEETIISIAINQVDWDISDY